jgi:glycerol uptake facilitator-like aquaporin
MATSAFMKNETTKAPFAGILRDSVLELILTALMLFGVTTIVRWVVGPSPLSRTVSAVEPELLIVGASVTILIAGLILSPAGKKTGAHMNPAISLAMWRFGVFPGAAVVPYIVAQLLGSVLGVVTARVAWGPTVAEAPVALRGATTGARLVQLFAFYW